MKFNTRYSGSKKVSIKFDEPSLTDQSFKDECDLGFIVESYVNKGLPLPTSTMNYMDCTSVQQFDEAMQLVSEAKSNFEQLPAKERDRFKTVENYLDFISKSENLRESYEKGYIDPNSVSLSDVYPEREDNSSIVPDKPVQEQSPVAPSTETTE